MATGAIWITFKHDGSIKQEDIKKILRKIEATVNLELMTLGVSSVENHALANLRFPEEGMKVHYAKQGSFGQIKIAKGYTIEGESGAVVYEKSKRRNTTSFICYLSVWD